MAIQRQRRQPRSRACARPAPPPTPATTSPRKSQRLSAAILYLTPVPRKEHTKGLLAKFDAAWAAEDHATVSDVITQLTEVLGEEHMREVTRLVLEGDAAAPQAGE